MEPKQGQFEGGLMSDGKWFGLHQQRRYLGNEGPWGKGDGVGCQLTDSSDQWTEALTWTFSRKKVCPVIKSKTTLREYWIQQYGTSSIASMMRFGLSWPRSLEKKLFPVGQTITRLPSHPQWGCKLRIHGKRRPEEGQG